MRNFIFKINALCLAHRQIISYLFFGVCAMVLNTLCYYAAYQVVHLNNTVSTILAWLAAVIFAFITNKFLVFKSRRTRASEYLSEITSFFSCRILTGILDVIIMVIAVDFLQWNSILWKLLSNVVVTVLNYVASKFFIFKNNRS